MSLTRSTRRLIEQAELANGKGRAYDPSLDPKPVYRHFDAPAPVQPTFAEQLAEAIGELVEAKIDYALARVAVGAEWASSELVNKADARLTTLLGRVAG